MKKRIWVMIAAYLAAAASAGLMTGLIIGVGMLANGMLEKEPGSVGLSIALLLVSAWWGAGFGGATIAAFALIPAALVIYYAELRRIQSWLFYAVSALLVTSVVAALYVFYGWFFQYVPPGDSRTDITVGLLAPTFLLAAICAFPAIVGGTVYWWIAGRNVGWLDRGSWLFYAVSALLVASVVTALYVFENTGWLDRG